MATTPIIVKCMFIEKICIPTLLQLLIIGYSVALTALQYFAIARFERVFGVCASLDYLFKFNFIAHKQHVFNYSLNNAGLIFLKISAINIHKSVSWFTIYEYIQKVPPKFNFRWDYF